MPICIEFKQIQFQLKPQSHGPRGGLATTWQPLVCMENVTTASWAIGRGCWLAVKSVSKASVTQALEPDYHEPPGNHQLLGKICIPQLVGKWSLEVTTEYKEYFFSCQQIPMVACGLT